MFSCAFVAFADPEVSESETEAASAYSITINNAIPAETYRAFKIFDASLGEMPAGSTVGSSDAFAYSITPESQWWSVVTTPTSGTVDTTRNQFVCDGLIFQKTALTRNGYPVYNVTREEGHTAADNASFARALANKLYGALSGKTTPYTQNAPDAAAPATKSSVTFNVTDPGYYFVTTTIGSLCVLDTTSPTVTVDDKNDVPVIDKKISKTSGSNWSDGMVNASIGDRVYFQLEVTDGKGTNKSILVEDRMTDGIALYYADPEDNTTHDITVLAGDPLAEVTAGPDTYTVTVNDDHSFDVTFAEAYVAGLGDYDHVYITYSGYVTDDAVVKGTTDNNGDELFNTNDVTLTYRHWESTDQVGVETYEFDLVKTTSPTYQERLLNGATFKLYGSVSGNDEISLVLEDTIYEIDNNTGLPTETVASRVYRKALPGETPVAAIEAGLATIRGLGNGSYFVEEIEAPEGYNKLQSRESISLSGNNDKATFLANGGYDDGGLQVINRTGAELPSTGGIGTYLFYGVGAILVVGAVVVLVSKKRMHAFGD